MVKASSDGSSEIAQTLAAGVIHRVIAVGDGTGIELVDIDRQLSAARVAIAVDSTERVTGIAGPVARAFTPRDWLARTGALVAVNGGYFGDETADGRKEVVGLLVTRGCVRRPAGWLTGRGGVGLAPALYTRSAFGLVGPSRPSIAWVVSGPVGSGKVYSVPSPTQSLALRKQTASRWPVRSAIGCGPMLIWNGKTVVTDRQERLASPGAEPRTFIAYDRHWPQPDHVVVGIASEIAYSDIASFLQHYFKSYDRARAGAAMCLDGGASTQFSYRSGGVVNAARDTGVAVPDAVVVLPG